MTNKHYGCCPECGSGDLHWCNISVRANCPECHWWQPVHFESKRHALRKLHDIQIAADVEPHNQLGMDSAISEAKAL